MIYIKAKFLEVQEIPEQRPYPKACRVYVDLDGDRLSFIARHAVLTALEEYKPTDEILFEAKPWTLYMAREGSADGKAFRMTIIGIAEGAIQ